MRRTAPVLPLLLLLGLVVPFVAFGQAIPPAFDAPWIGYDTAVYPEGLDPWDAASGDFDSDGVPDLATVSWGGTPWLSVLMGDGEGGYEAAVTYSLLFESLGLEVADFDRDGDLDIVVADTGRLWEGTTISLYNNDGSGAFAYAGSFETGVNGPTGITVADLDGDQFVDVAVAHDQYISFGHTIATMLNNGAGGFLPGRVVGLDSGTRAIAAGDVDGDGDADLVVGFETNKFNIMLNTNGFFFETEVIPGLDAGSIPELPQVHLTDIDLDGDLDIFFSNRDTGGFGTGSIGLWRNQGGGVFGVGEELSFDWYTSGGVGMETADVTGDGWPDILVVSASDNWFLFDSDGAGGFAPPRRLRAGEGSITVETPDLDGDGDLDAVILATGSLEACVYLNPGDGGFIQPSVIDMTDPSIAPAFPTNLQAGDIDDDGDLDLVVGYRSDFSNKFGISVRRNNGDGTFAPIEIYPDTTYAQMVRIGDLDGDFDLDLLWVDSGGRLKRRLNQGDGSFGTIKQLKTIFGASFLDLYDVDVDGDLDSVLATGFDAVVLLNDGRGTFGSPISTGFNFFSNLTMGDFNGDQIPDLLTDSGVQGYPQISNGNGDGTFQPANTVTTGRDVRALTTGDLDGDGNLDFAAIYNLDEKGLSIRRGRGNGDFHLGESYHGSRGFSDHESSVIVAEADGDGLLDAMTANIGAQDLSLWSGNGDGTFRELVRYGVAEQAFDLAYGDFNGDGIGDAAVITQTDTGRYWYPGVVLLKGLRAEAQAQLDLTQGDLRVGQTANWTVTAAVPGETVSVLSTLSGTGAGRCVPALDGLCLDLLDPLRVVGTAVADASGTAEVSFVVPVGAPVGSEVFSQAVARRGPGGVDSVKSNVSVATVQP